MACDTKGVRVKHFNEEDWLDFVRGTMPESRRAAMEQHLGSECPECLRLRGFWENVRTVALRESAIEIPPEVVRAGKALFADWRLRFVVPGQARFARAIFDSLLEPLPAGFRSPAQPPRRVLYRRGQWTVDLRIEAQPVERVSVTGQLLKPGWQSKEGSKTGVLLVSQDKTLSETEMNQFGEFQLTFHRAPDLMIYIMVSGRHVIAIDLPDPDKPLQFRKRSSSVENRGHSPA